MKKYFIYGLYRGDDLFYVGVTIDCRQRERGHKRAHGGSISMVVFDEYYGSLDTAMALESFWIKRFRDLRIDLLNKVKKNPTKKTYTFATTDSIWEKAKKKARREGTTISEKIDEWLREYAYSSESEIEV